MANFLKKMQVKVQVHSICVSVALLPFVGKVVSHFFLCSKRNANILSLCMVSIQERFMMVRIHYTPIPRLTLILAPEKTMLRKKCISGILLMFQLMQNSPTSEYIS